MPRETLKQKIDKLEMKTDGQSDLRQTNRNCGYKTHAEKKKDELLNKRRSTRYHPSNRDMELYADIFDSPEDFDHGDFESIVDAPLLEKRVADFSNKLTDAQRKHLGL